MGLDWLTIVGTRLESRSTKINPSFLSTSLTQANKEWKSKAPNSIELMQSNKNKYRFIV